MTDYKKESCQNDTDSRKIADLCLGCGKCCEAVVTEFELEELIEMAKKDEREAKIFVHFFKRYDTIADARKVVPDQVAQVLAHKEIDENAQGKEVQFYYCDKITKDKKCTMYNDRPICCRTAPAHGWTLMPPKCGYTGWQFGERERIKKSVRLMKEKIYEIETLEGSDAFVEDLSMSLKDLKADVNKKIQPFKNYGSERW